MDREVVQAVLRCTSKKQDPAKCSETLNTIYILRKENFSDLLMESVRTMVRNIRILCKNKFISGIKFPEGSVLNDFFLAYSNWRSCEWCSKNTLRPPSHRYTLRVHNTTCWSLWIFQALHVFVFHYRIFRVKWTMRWCKVRKWLHGRLACRLPLNKPCFRMATG